MNRGATTTGIFCNLGYIRKMPVGILKLIELLIDLLALILGGAANNVEGFSGHKGFFIFVAVLAFVVTLGIFITGILNIQAICLSERWPLIEMVWCGLIALLYFIGSIVVAIPAKYNGVYGAAAFFGFAAFIVYVGEMIYRIRENPSRASGRSPSSEPSRPTY